MSTLTVVMEKTDPKKHSVRYDAIEQDRAAIRTVYISKAALPPVAPDRVVLSVEF